MVTVPGLKRLTLPQLLLSQMNTLTGSPPKLFECRSTTSNFLAHIQAPFSYPQQTALPALAP